MVRTTHTGTDVGVVRYRILGVSDEVMLFHSEKLATLKTMSFYPNPSVRFPIWVVQITRSESSESVAFQTAERHQCAPSSTVRR